MSFNPDLEEIQKVAKSFIDANVWDSDDRVNVTENFARFSPSELQKLIFDLLEFLSEGAYL